MEAKRLWVLVPVFLAAGALTYWTIFCRKSCVTDTPGMSDEFVPSNPGSRCWDDFIAHWPEAHQGLALDYIVIHKKPEN
jgi:hypothetical protein